MAVDKAKTLGRTEFVLPVTLKAWPEGQDQISMELWVGEFTVPVEHLLSVIDQALTNQSQHPLLRAVGRPGSWVVTQPNSFPVTKQNWGIKVHAYRAITGRRILCFESASGILREQISLSAFMRLLGTVERLRAA